ncbi:Aldehyde dehydrogenase (EC [Bathymodiolus azoricus thioautotrophic gill symbiont]|uniref:Aldehyde dehydrogenase (EC) n=1 Tax=Bathymodiolus azoricus thioautotrophic gill symbiont TaxID=235205 RepID=A0ACA8ZSW0_9GAMM|nr:Aldehyde dehydrogenase (EC [Bathymodiolus azoricus thioautotrophic gill symbiont]
MRMLDISPYCWEKMVLTMGSTLVGRETHKMMLDHYQQTKNMLVSYDINPLGFF